jgi:hypothetical protein
MVSPRVLAVLRLINHQLEFGRLLNEQIGGLGAFQDLVHVAGGAATQVGKASSIGHQPAAIDGLLQLVHGGQPSF